MIGRSPAFRAVVHEIRAAAPSDASVMLIGESGTGKEEAAREIHRLSARDGRFIGVNCAAFPEGLIESHLFGHERGAFTGADQKHIGFFEQANRGTLFLDEITETAPSLQAKLLRVLEQREVTRVAGTFPVALDVRVIAASNRSLRAAIAEGVLRSDLYYRLNTFEIELPPLRKRVGDIEPLAEFFVAEYNRRQGTRIEGLNPEFAGALKAHDWPGNIRELRNAVERAVIIQREGLLAVENLPGHILGIRAEQEPFRFRVGMTMEEVRREVVKRTFVANNGNLARTAAMLDVTRNTVYRALTAGEPEAPNTSVLTAGRRSRPT